MKYLFLLSLVPTLLWADTDYAKGCLMAKEAFDIRSKLEDANVWSEVQTSNGYEEWGTRAKCIKGIEKNTLIFLQVESWGPFSGDDRRGCELFDVVNKRRMGKVEFSICKSEK